MRMELIAYNLTDLDESKSLLKIMLQYYSTSPWPMTLEKVMHGGGRYFKAMQDGKQIGITGYVLKTPTLAETVKTTVFEEYRARGMGQDLSLAIEEECKSNGVKKVMTTIFHFNHTMIKIKLKQGYTIEGYHPDHEAPGFHEYSLGKKLL